METFFNTIGEIEAYRDRIEKVLPELRHERYNKRRQAFSKGCANEMWQLDTMFGPYLKPRARLS